VPFPYIPGSAEDTYFYKRGLSEPVRLVCLLFSPAVRLFSKAGLLLNKSVRPFLLSRNHQISTIASNSAQRFLAMASIIQNSSPLETVKTFIACVKTKNLDLMRRLIHPKATACLIRDGEPRFQTLSGAIERLEKAEQELVEVSWDEVEHANGEFATVWASFSILMDGVASSSPSRQYENSC
jgi:hypothetical protein